MTKEKSITELKDERNQLITRSKEIINGAKTETRQFKPEETEELGENQRRRAEIELEIEEREMMNRGSGKPHVQPGQERFSFRRALANYVSGQEQNAADASVIESTTNFHNGCGIQRASKTSLVLPIESRATFTAATESTTGVVIDQEQQEMLLPLQSSLVLAKAGARFMTGLQGDIYWPKYSGSNVFWEGENAKAKDGAGEFSKGDAYKPKRLTAYVDISEQLLIQENTSVEAIIRQTLATAIAQKVEQTAFGTHAHDDNKPDGLFQDVPTISGTMDWTKVVELETNADLQNALYGNLAYIMHPALVGKAKTKVKDASGAGGFIFGESGVGMLNGYRSLRTNNLPKGLQTAKDEYGIIFGNWNDYFIGQWGALEIKVDPYSRMLEGVVRLVVNSYWNMGMIRSESFSVASMK
nr:MAG TPA: major capsid protein [Caudoviricetes sp.]